MTKTALVVLLLSVPCLAKGVRGYVKSNGTVVAPHQRTAANGTKADNYSTKGNTNPYTGEKGTKDPYAPK